jgi:hypothetical protein
MNKATNIWTATFGALVGLIGIEHGIGEVLQGSIAPDGIMILSWPGSAFFEILAGEPAMTIIPNLLLTGILAIFFSMLYLIWAVFFIEREHSGWVLVFLSVPMLLAGGGVFPPLLGIIIGVTAARFQALQSRQPHVSPGWKRFLAKLWPWAFGAGILTWLAMFPGICALDYFFGVKTDTIILIDLAGMFGFLLASAVAGFARDNPIQTGLPGKPVMGLEAGRTPFI